MQNPRAVIPALGGNGFPVTRTYVADVSAILGSLDIVFGEIDC
jgi:NADH:ubiquinone oxidoreductase subunit D